MRHDLLFSPRRIADRAAYLMPPLTDLPPCLAIQWDGRRLACYEVPTIDGVADFIEREGVLIPVQRLPTILAPPLLAPVDFNTYHGAKKYKRNLSMREFHAWMYRGVMKWRERVYGEKNPCWLPGDPE